MTADIMWCDAGEWKLYWMVIVTEQKDNQHVKCSTSPALGFQRRLNGLVKRKQAWLRQKSYWWYLTNQTETSDQMQQSFCALLLQEGNGWCAS